MTTEPFQYGQYPTGQPLTLRLKQWGIDDAPALVELGITRGWCSRYTDRVVEVIPDRVRQRAINFDVSRML